MSIFKRVAVPKNMRKKIHARYNGVCYLCGKYVSLKDMHADHLVPVALGGQTTISNLAPTHAVCNQRKGKKL
jgi:5-methylcytosine-specific restriction endonuclease McrA